MNWKAYSQQTAKATENLKRIVHYEIKSPTGQGQKIERRYTCLSIVISKKWFSVKRGRGRRKRSGRLSPIPKTGRKKKRARGNDLQLCASNQNR